MNSFALQNSVVLSSLFLFAAGPVVAQTINFAPGNRGGEYTTGSDGPAHVVDGLFGATEWNNFGANNGGSGVFDDPVNTLDFADPGIATTSAFDFKFADGSNAPGVAIDFGLGGAVGAAAIDFSLKPRHSNTPFGDGTPFGNDLWKNWAFSDGRSGGTTDVAARISGLAPSSYRVYIMAREANQAARTYSADIGNASTSAIDAGITFGDFGSGHVGVTSPNLDSIDPLEDYFFEDITLAAGEEVVVITRATGPAGAEFGHIGGIQIVSLDSIVVTTPGDVNGDNKVDLDDYEIITMNYRAENPTRGMGDISGANGFRDGVVDLNDFRAWRANYTPPNATSNVTAVPEPATAFLLAMATLLVATGRRNQRRH